MAARISHPNVVTVFDAGREADSLYIVMELVSGESLGGRLARGEFPSAPEALEMAAQVADALGAAHALGVVHRDIKPGNVMVTPSGRIKVADFGIAKAAGEETGLTRTGTVVGSPAKPIWGDGWTIWFLSWRKLLQGSATKQAMLVDSSGSQFLSPAATSPNWRRAMVAR